MLALTTQLIEDGMAAGLHHGAQLYVSMYGKVAADLAFGESRPGVRMTPETIMLWLSSGKPIGAVAALQLVERGQLNLDDPVCRILPEFATGGKEQITTRHLLLHTCGFRWAEPGWPENNWDQIIAALCAADLERRWVVGETAGYHPTTSWYILGELVRCCDGRHYRNYVRDEIFLPLGLNDSWVGMPAERFDEYGERMGIMPDTSAPNRPPHRYSCQQGATDCVPGGNAHGPIRELGRFYESLLFPDRGPAALLSAESLDLLSTRQRLGKFDKTFQHVMDWGLGTMIDSNRYGAETVPYGFGLHCSERTFGHGGSQSSVGLADPEHGLVVAVVFAGMPGEPAHQTRIRALLTAVYEDLGLAR